MIWLSVEYISDQDKNIYEYNSAFQKKKRQSKEIETRGFYYITYETFLNQQL